MGQVIKKFSKDTEDLNNTINHFDLICIENYNQQW